MFSRFRDELSSPSPKENPAMKYGDIIKYPRLGGLYKHYAVYTGKNKDGQDTVVEFTGESGQDSKAGATVQQGLFKPGGKVENFDNVLGLKPQPEDEMKKAVNQLLKDGSGQYGVLDNNCEHVATFVRYGTPRSLQADAVLKTPDNLNNELSENMGASFTK